MKLFALFASLICALQSFAADTKPGAAADKKAAVKNVNAEEFDRLRKEKDTVVIDVRTADEYADGHLKDSILIDFRSPEFADKVAKLDKGKTYLVHCAAGGRSAKACSKMDALGFKTVNLEGGLGAWKDAGKPVVK